MRDREEEGVEGQKEVRTWMLTRREKGFSGQWVGFLNFFSFLFFFLILFRFLISIFINILDAFGSLYGFFFCLFSFVNASSSWWGVQSSGFSLPSLG